MQIGIIGTNFISDWFMDAVRKVEGIEANFVFSRKEETGKAFAEKHGIDEVYTNFEGFLNNSKMDAVYVASPNYAHCEQVIELLNHGKHVLCEKSIVLNEEEFGKVKEAAFRNQKVLLEAMRPLFDPAYVILKEQISKIGKVRRATMEYCQYSSRYDAFKEGTILNAFDPNMHNSAVLDIGVYCIEVMLMLFGIPEDVKSMSSRLSNGFEGQGISLFKYQDMIGEVIYSKIADSCSPSIIQGENGSICIQKIAKPSDITIHYRDGKTETVFHNDHNENMHYEIEAFCRLVEQNCIDHEYLKISESCVSIMKRILRA